MRFLFHSILVKKNNYLCKKNMDKTSLIWPKDVSSIDNLSIIKALLNFIDEGDFYAIQIIKRKKDNPEFSSSKVIKTHYIESIEHLDYLYGDIKKMCSLFNARAYIDIQKKNHNDVPLVMLALLANRIQCKQMKQVHLFDKAVGATKSREKRWIIDIDSKEPIDNMISTINDISPVGNKIEAVIPTKNGFHIICKPFNVTQFNFPDVEVKKKNPTLLFLP